MAETNLEHSRYEDSKASVSEMLGEAHLRHQRPPSHPISSMQGPFEESIMEATDPVLLREVNEKLDVHARRQQLLELEDFSNGYSPRWRQKPEAKFHPLWKLIAQISFGVHLIHQRQARSNVEVVKIIQMHVDEVDCFLEDTLADFDLATADIQDRIQNLLLPLEHVRTFDKMLGNKAFRNGIIEGNHIIDRILDRTTRAMNNSLTDVSNGIDATAELSKFLERVGSQWMRGHEDLHAIHAAMCGNAHGWHRCFRELQVKGKQLAVLMLKLESIVAEVAKRCGIAQSKRLAVGSLAKNNRQRPSASVARPPPSSKYSQSDILDKALPPEPVDRTVTTNKAQYSPKSSSSTQHTAVRGEPAFTTSREDTSADAQSTLHPPIYLANPEGCPLTSARRGPSMTREADNKTLTEGSRDNTSSKSIADRGTHKVRYRMRKGSEQSSSTSSVDSAYFSASDKLETPPEPIADPILPTNLVTLPDSSSLEDPLERNLVHHRSRPSLTALPTVPRCDSNLDLIVRGLEPSSKKAQPTKTFKISAFKPFFVNKGKPKERRSLSGGLGGHVGIAEL